MQTFFVEIKCALGKTYAVASALAETEKDPKLAVHTHGGYAVHSHATGRWCFGLRPSDVWWSTSDIGWVVGHSYIVYAPLLIGCTTIAFEGALDHPGPRRSIGASPTTTLPGSSPRRRRCAC